ncbi:MAG: helix-turn-helix transcriptional regulator [Leptolyngbya sp. SIO4C5]|uniref:helix-turn-helix transcriptional regulator n=1 Tax=Sphaerothrix gracilis TaxID=3151835 RepID=UPI0013C0DE82|nr:helix-turn-helix transcriptional regulator [Leptolyngbya sp. SIO4C5]
MSKASLNLNIEKTSVHLSDSDTFCKFNQFLNLESLLSELIEGILVLTTQRKLIYATPSARRALNYFRSEDIAADIVPQEIWHVCQYLIQSRYLFPNQHWLVQSEIFVENEVTLQVRARWLSVDRLQESCLLLFIEDKQQAIQSIAYEEAEQYGLTPREKEVWLLHRQGQTYKQIAAELDITPNTVKKHMRSVHAKQKQILAPDCISS